MANLQLRQDLTITQQLVMTPQLQQAIKLLQLSRLELIRTIRQEIESNPILEEEMDLSEHERIIGNEPELIDPWKLPKEGISEQAERESDWEAYLSEFQSRWVEDTTEDREYPSFEAFTSQKTNLSSHLMWQLNLSKLTEEQKRIGEYIIGNLNEDGYLIVSIDELVKMTGHSKEEIEEVLGVIQTFDPVGVAARDTRECLLLQARFHKLGNTIVEEIISEHLHALSNKRYDLIAKALKISVEEVLKTVKIISGFDPKPGRRYSDEQTIYIVPDIYIVKVGDGFEIILNDDGLPKLRINAFYRDLISQKDSVDEKTKEYIQEKLKSAMWLIKSIHQRQRTIFRVTESILKFQREFFEKGISYLKPLVLRDVAEDVQMHESTISRVTSNKYVHTPQGIFELKFFFNSAVDGFDGKAVSSETVKEKIREIIRSENKKRPFSDQEVVEILKKYNINIARRTV
ncbi:MAG TPA: RNA polymerase sigma-54 factor, partial [Desulfobacteraceae bacterium]|nr:RNA polymerase sigma-54 factor [Desulfobacteraceae bacterium]